MSMFLDKVHSRKVNVEYQCLDNINKEISFNVKENRTFLDLKSKIYKKFKKEHSIDICGELILENENLNFDSILFETIQDVIFSRYQVILVKMINKEFDNNDDEIMEEIEEPSQKFENIHIFEFNFYNDLSNLVKLSFVNIGVKFEITNRNFYRDILNMKKLTSLKFENFRVLDLWFLNEFSKKPTKKFSFANSLINDEIPYLTNTEVILTKKSNYLILVNDLNLRNLFSKIKKIKFKDFKFFNSIFFDRNSHFYKTCFNYTLLNPTSLTFHHCSFLDYNLYEIIDYRVNLDQISLLTNAPILNQLLIANHSAISNPDCHDILLESIDTAFKENFKNLERIKFKSHTSKDYSSFELHTFLINIHELQNLKELFLQNEALEYIGNVNDTDDLESKLIDSFKSSQIKTLGLGLKKNYDINHEIFKKIAFYINQEIFIDKLIIYGTARHIFFERSIIFTDRVRYLDVKFFPDFSIKFLGNNFQELEEITLRKCTFNKEIDKNESYSGKLERIYCDKDTYYSLKSKNITLFNNTIDIESRWFSENELIEIPLSAFLTRN